MKNLWAHYAAESELADRFIGRILQKIDDLQLWENTVVVVMSDHGMSIGEHDRAGKSNIHDQDDRYWPIYPEIGHELFLIAGGDIPCGQSLDLIAQPIDILPTLCELADVDVEPPKAFDGISFADGVLEGKSKHRNTPLVVIASERRERGHQRKRRHHFLSQIVGDMRPLAPSEGRNFMI